MQYSSVMHYFSFANDSSFHNCCYLCHVDTFFEEKHPALKNIFFIILYLIGLHLPINAQDGYKIPDKVKKILFLGNSITYGGQYVAYIETMLTLHHSDVRYEFINAGLPSETVSGLSEKNHAGGKFERPDLHDRLSKVLMLTDPDLVIACYGMNDGIYLPFDDRRFKKFKSGIIRLHDQITKTGASIIFLTPPVYDVRKNVAYSNVLDLYSDWLISKRYTSKWDVVDLHWPIKKYLEDRRANESGFALAPDGIHPDDTGHWLMAREVLLYLGVKNVAQTDDISTLLPLYKNGQTIYQLISQKMNITKDAWLTAAGHKRPEMNKGIPLADAKKKAYEIELQIRDLLK